MRKPKVNFLKHDFLINQLMQLYSFLLILMALVIMLALSIYTGIERFNTSNRLAENSSMQLDTYVKERNAVVSSVLGEFTTSDTAFESLRNYLQLSLPDYFSYSNEIFRQSGQSVYLPNILYRLLREHADIEEIIVQLDESDDLLIASPQAPYGGKHNDVRIDLANRLYFARPISQPSNYAQPLGQVYVVFQADTVMANQAQDNQLHGVSSFLYTANGQQLFQSADGLSEEEIQQIDDVMARGQGDAILDKAYYVQRQQTVSGEISLVLLSKKIIWGEIIQKTLVIFAIGAAVIGLLLWILQRTFKRYTWQVKTIVSATKAVSQGDFKNQIDTKNVQQELKEIAEAINQMTVSINDYIEDIYTLEIKQRDADMRALQAQINPHFLYNTLEYIRMYALSRNQEELADVVYAFSALLRNNTTQEKVKTLAEEVAFCEKYVYLYQMRYPDKIAYHVTVDPELAQLYLPKFTLQPLVENYFVHGIDYQRNDNAISIKAYKDEGHIVIQIKDNGKGATAEEVAKINDTLKIAEIEKQTSIGIKNVHERLRGLFGKAYRMEIDAQKDAGFLITIYFTPEALKKGMTHVV
ncbi:sensor histidine kinase [Enterococcus sp.]|uniref:sensor histidine kinase n=1 Tax=Enterococcus sp. TaxID=35783 RepID=UPI000ECAFAD1|nr:sensor histidine kinase [Enterococcus sp.]HCE11524.1 sensor histidine kinase [Enterococcus sp.]